MTRQGTVPSWNEPAEIGVTETSSLERNAKWREVGESVRFRALGERTLESATVRRIRS